jgi:hypothetical protein
MKKIFFTFFISFLFIFQTFSYNPTIDDEKILNNIYSKIDVLCLNNINNCKILENKIIILENKYNKFDKIIYLLNNIKSYI